MTNHTVLKKLMSSDMKEEEKIDLAYRVGQMEVISAFCILLPTLSEDDLYYLVEEMRKQKREEAYNSALCEITQEIEKGKML